MQNISNMTPSDVLFLCDTTQCTTSWQAGKAHSPVSTLNTLHSAQQAGKAHSPVSRSNMRLVFFTFLFKSTDF